MGKKLLGLLLLGTSVSVYAQEDDSAELDRFRQRVEESVVNPVVYAGQEGANINDGRFMFCDQERTRFSDWKAPVDQFSSSADPSTQEVKIFLSFKPSFLELRSYSKQAWSFCAWTGGDTRVSVDRLTTIVRIKAIPNVDHPQVILDKFVIDGLNIKLNMGSSLFAKLFDLRRVLGEGADFILNKTIAAILATNLKARLSNVITAKVADGLDQYRLDQASPGLPIDTIPEVH